MLGIDLTDFSLSINVRNRIFQCYCRTCNSCNFLKSYLQPVVQIFVEHWGDNLQFYPNFTLSSTLGGMNLDQDLFQVSKLSEDQKKGLHQKWNTFFPRIQAQTCATKHTRVKLLEGMQMNTILKLLGGIQSNYCGIYPPSWISVPLLAAIFFKLFEKRRN